MTPPTIQTTAELVSVSIETATAQTLMDWGALHFTDAGWTLDLDIWRTHKAEAAVRLEHLEHALTRIADEARQSADTYGCANCNAFSEIASRALTQSGNK